MERSCSLANWERRRASWWDEGRWRVGSASGGMRESDRFVSLSELLFLKTIEKTGHTGSVRTPSLFANTSPHILFRCCCNAQNALLCCPRQSLLHPRPLLFPEIHHPPFNPSFTLDQCVIHIEIGIVHGWSLTFVPLLEGGRGAVVCGDGSVGE